MIDLDLRAEKEARYMLEKGCTIRACSLAFGLSKSTIHNDLSKRLKKCNYTLFLRLKPLLLYNFENKHIHGGNATKNKYKKQKNSPKN